MTLAAQSLPASKYGPLAEFLARQDRQQVPMTFSAIEAVIGAPLPASARTHRAWWSNNPTNNVMTRAWLAAGYRTAEVDMAGERLVFERDPDAAPAPTPGAGPAAAPVAPPRSGPDGSGADHPLWGIAAVTLRLQPGTDLTAPADPAWEAEALAAHKQLEAGTR